MRANPKLDVASAITELGVGAALVSLLDEKGRPCIVERAFVVPPSSQIGPLTDTERRALLDNSIVAGVYEKTVDRASAYEVLKGRTETGQGDAAKTVGASGSQADGAVTPAPTNAAGASSTPEPGFFDKLGGMFGGTGTATAGSGRTVSRREGIGQAMAKSAARAIGSQVGREILRGVLGSILGGRRR